MYIVALQHGSLLTQISGLIGVAATQCLPLIIHERVTCPMPQGRVNETGYVSSSLSLQANIRAQQRASFKKITEQVKKKQPLEKMVEDSVYFDPRVKHESTQRNKKGFKFNEPGGCYLE